MKTGIDLCMNEMYLFLSFVHLLQLNCPNSDKYTETKARSFHSLATLLLEATRDGSQHK